MSLTQYLVGSFSCSYLEKLISTLGGIQIFCTCLNGHYYTLCLISSRYGSALPNNVTRWVSGNVCVRLSHLYAPSTHCKNTIPKIRNKQAIYIFPRSVCLFSCRKICGPILGIYTLNRSKPHECVNWDWCRKIPFLGIPKWDFRCCAKWRRIFVWFGVQTH